MPSYSNKAARERAERFENSWEENAPDKTFGNITLTELKADRAAIAAKEDEIALSKAHTKTLQIELKDMNKDLMKKCDYVVDGVVGDRNYGADSAIYAGFGYIRESERRRSGGRNPAPQG